MSDKTYRVVEVFLTLQGEGVNAGVPSLFVRFAGCNLWSGHAEHRERDAVRHGAECPRWCDTDFRSGTSFLRSDLAKFIAFELGDAPVPLIVFTGGEPLLQLDAELLQEICDQGVTSKFAVETNGTTHLSESLREWLDWVCVSPKVKVEDLAVRKGDELKVVYPSFDPRDYEGLDFTHRVVSPLASTSDVGVSVLELDTEKRAAEFCIQNPKWRLSLQSHKRLGLR